MPEATIKLSVYITLDVPEEHAAKVTRDDLVEMARRVIPDSMTIPDPANGLGGPCNGVQLQVDSVCQEEVDGSPLFADVRHIEHDICEDPDIEFDDGVWTTAEGES